MVAKQLLIDFANWSTVAGIPLIANAKSTAAKIFWWVVFLAMCGLFIYQLYCMIAKFFSYPSSVTTDILFQEQTFPVLTVCNLNPYKYSIVKNNTAFATINTLMNVYTSAVYGTLLTPDIFGIYDVKDTAYERDSRARDALILAAAQLTDAQKMPALYTYNELITDCSFSGKTCGSTDFTQFIDPVYGACYAFNENTALNYSSNRAGMKFGLKLLVTVSQETPSGGNDFLPTTTYAGVRIAVTSRNQQPTLDSDGLDVGVGFQTAVSLTLSQLQRATKPYGRCVAKEPDATNYYQSKTYNLDTCYMGCRQRDIIKNCGCADPRYNKTTSDPWCTPTKANIVCLQGLKGDQTNSTNPNINPLLDCGCNPPCQETTFYSSASIAKYPADNYYVATDSNAGVAGSCDNINTNFNQDPVKCREWYESNGLLLQVFFADLKYEQYTEGSDYGISDVINDLGGNAGLWLGLSVISVVELFGLIAIIIAFCVAGSKMKIRPKPEKTESDFSDSDDEKPKKTNTPKTK